MLSRRCEIFKAKMADSSNYVVYFLYLLTTAKVVFGFIFSLLTALVK